MTEILEDFIVVKAEGLYCPYGDFYLDAIKPVPVSIVSHAHGDHCCAGCSTVYSTPETASLMTYRFGKRTKHTKFRHYSEDEHFEINQVSIRFFAAGHILGSVMIQLSFRGVVYLYTGDYKLQHDRTCKAAKISQADVLITESTFADPAIRHPDVNDELEKLKHISYPILLGAYALGKAQRLTALIQDFLPEREIFVHHQVLPYHRIYEEFGMMLGTFKPYHRKAMKSPDSGAIYIVPPLTFHSYAYLKGAVKLFASGWEGLHRRNHESFYISDHVDWPQILETIEAVNPSRIWTVHGNGSFLEKHLSGKIVKALI